MDKQNLDELIAFFRSKIQSTKGGSNRKIFERFLKILTSLQNKELTIQQLELIESKLATMQLTGDTAQPKKYYGKKLNEFIAFLNKEYALITEGHYMQLFMIYGLTFGSGMGVALGTAFSPGIGTALGISLGTGIGMTIGIIIGSAKDAEAKKENRVLI